MPLSGGAADQLSAVTPPRVDGAPEGTPTLRPPIVNMSRTDRTTNTADEPFRAALTLPV